MRYWNHLIANYSCKVKRIYEGRCKLKNKQKRTKTKTPPHTLPRDEKIYNSIT